jgi:hypothetical protein
MMRVPRKDKEKTKSETFPSGPSIMALLYEHCSDLERRSTSTSNFPESLRYEYWNERQWRLFCKLANPTFLKATSYYCALISHVDPV